MSKGFRFLESPATEEENSYDYRVEWDDHFELVSSSSDPVGETVHYGSDSRTFYNDYDNAWLIWLSW